MKNAHHNKIYVMIILIFLVGGGIMPFDGLAARAIVHEMRENILYGMIFRICQPDKFTLVLNVKKIHEKFRLFASCDPSGPRINFTEFASENPINPSNFCMSLRKHLSGGKVMKITQIGLDRLIKIDIENMSEIGELLTFSLFVEIMGRNSNIILVNSDSKILSSMRQVDSSMSRFRQIMPGMKYNLPPKQDKINPLIAEKKEILQCLENNNEKIATSKFLVKNFEGISELAAGEILNFCKNPNDIENLADCIINFFNEIRNNNFSPCIIFDQKNNILKEFSCVNVNQFSELKKESYKRFSEAVEKFFGKTTSSLKNLSKYKSLIKVVEKNINKSEKRIAIHEKNLQNSGKINEFKMYGDLIFANIDKIRKGDKEVLTTNYFKDAEEGLPAKFRTEKILVPLDETLTPSRNAEAYYKEYTKGKTSQKISRKQLEIAKNEKYYLDSVLVNLKNADSLSDLEETTEELVSQGYIKKNKRQKRGKSLPLSFISSDGYKILVGKNNRQNDNLTLKSSFSTDLWFHVKKVPGSHTILKTERNVKIPEKSIFEAALLAAHFSKAANSSNIPVDFTTIKNVKKPTGARPGMVNYVNYKTIYVTPTDEIMKQIAKNSTQA
jgi:predicted ribosome quality control (RQC) complex YloA/Tae2 family protein